MRFIRLLAMYFLIYFYYFRFSCMYFHYVYVGNQRMLCMNECQSSVPSDVLKICIHIVVDTEAQREAAIDQLSHGVGFFSQHASPIQL